MLYSYNWLKEFSPNLPSTNELLEKLTLHSVELEGIIESEDLGNVVVAEVVETRKHGNSDNLNIGVFDVGEPELRQIVFGGKAALQPGQKIAVALAPTVIPRGLAIKERKLRGELSQGMCCLNSELGILDRTDTVHLFPAAISAGTPVVDVIGTTSPLIDIENKTMTHRSDLFCHAGISREIAAVFNTEYVVPELPDLPGAPETVQVSIENQADCRRYIGVELQVSVGKTPSQIAQRLQDCGITSINNVVDITNYVMLEFGEPLHAFDADTLASNDLQVRRAKPGEVIFTLDNDTKELDSTMLVIADNTKPVAVAGVIGGMDTRVTNTTTRIILEAATFDSVTIRQTARGVGVRTDGSVRWEKGIQPELAQIGAQRAIQLLQEHAGATVLGITDWNPTQRTETVIRLSREKLQRISGMDLPDATVLDYLQRLKCPAQLDGTDFVVMPPWFRTDLQIAEDIIEEVVRLFGVNNVVSQPLTGVLAVPNADPELVTSKYIKEQLVRLGLNEVRNYAFYGDALLAACGLTAEPDHVEIMNPLSEDQRYLRTSVVPRLLENVVLNQTAAEQLNFFEVGHVFFADREPRQLGLVMSGPDCLRRLRGSVDALMSQLGIAANTAVITQSSDCAAWELYAAGQALELRSRDSIIGTLGQLNPAASERLGINQPVAFAVLSIAVLAKIKTTKRYQPLSAYPSIPLDLAFIVDSTTAWADIETIIKKEAGDMLHSLDVFDVYQGPAIPVGKKSVACHLVLQSQTKTLEMTAIEAWRAKLVKKLHKTLGAELRD